MHVKSTLIHNIIDGYKICSNHECKVENLWMQVTKGRSKYTIGGLYRHPGHKIVDFMQKIDGVFI